MLHHYNSCILFIIIFLVTDVYVMLKRIDCKKWVCLTKCSEGKMERHLDQHGSNTGTRATCGPQTVFVQPANPFCTSYITRSHKYIILATQSLQVTHHWSADQYVTIRVEQYLFIIYDVTIANLEAKLTLQYPVTTKHVFIFYLCCKCKLCN